MIGYLVPDNVDPTRPVRTTNLRDLFPPPEQPLAPLPPAPARPTIREVSK